MYRYLIYSFKKILRLLKMIITKLTFNFLLITNRNYKPIIIYIILVSFSTLFLVYQQSDSNITWNLLSESLIDDNEIIQVNKKFIFCFYLIHKYYFSVIFLNYHSIILI